MHYFTTALFLFLLAGLAMVHYLALEWHIYWLYPWFDILMHFWGGLVIAVGTQTPVFRSCMRVRIRTLWQCLLLVVGIGIAWEVFEWYFVIIDAVNYLQDTLLDILMDLSGGVLGFLLARFIQPKEENI